MVGGYDGQTRWNTAERYQPDTNTWQQLAPMSTTRSGLGEFKNQIRMDFSSFVTFIKKGRRWCFNEPLLCAGLVCMNSYLYAIGGYNGQNQLCSVERYNIARNVWEPRAPMHHCRSAHGVTVHQGCIFVFGKLLSPQNVAEIHSQMTKRSQR